MKNIDLSPILELAKGEDLFPQSNMAKRGRQKIELKTFEGKVGEISYVVASNVISIQKFKGEVDLSAYEQRFNSLAKKIEKEFVKPRRTLVRRKKVASGEYSEVVIN